MGIWARWLLGRVTSSAEQNRRRSAHRALGYLFLAGVRAMFGKRAGGFPGKVRTADRMGGGRISGSACGRVGAYRQKRHLDVSCPAEA